MHAPCTSRVSTLVHMPVPKFHVPQKAPFANNANGRPRIPGGGYFSGVLEVPTTSMPAAARCSAVPLPIPVEAPVISATLPTTSCVPCRRPYLDVRDALSPALPCWQRVCRPDMQPRCCAQNPLCSRAVYSPHIASWTHCLHLRHCRPCVRAGGLGRTTPAVQHPCPACSRPLWQEGCVN